MRSLRWILVLRRQVALHLLPFFLFSVGMLSTKTAQLLQFSTSHKQLSGTHHAHSSAHCESPLSATIPAVVPLVPSVVGRPVVVWAPPSTTRQRYPPDHRTRPPTAADRPPR